MYRGGSTPSWHWGTEEKASGWSCIRSLVMQSSRCSSLNTHHNKARTRTVDSSTKTTPMARPKPSPTAPGMSMAWRRVNTQSSSGDVQGQWGRYQYNQAVQGRMNPKSGNKPIQLTSTYNAFELHANVDLGDKGNERGGVAEGEQNGDKRKGKEGVSGGAVRGNRAVSRQV